jgi:hypothetical protein
MINEDGNAFFPYSTTENLENNLISNFLAIQSFEKEIKEDNESFIF